jgi:hypothetical protein
MKNQFTLGLLDSLVQTLRQYALRTHTLDSCVYTVSLLQATLERLQECSQIDLDSIPELQPLAVEVTALNPIMAQIVKAGDFPQTPEEVEAARRAGAYMVRIAPDPKVDYSQPGNTRFPGHLVLGVNFGQSKQGFWIADPSLDQASRPERGIPLAPGIFKAESIVGTAPGQASPWAHWRGEELNAASGCILAYYPSSCDPEIIHRILYSSPDWARGQLEAQALNLEVIGGEQRA